MRPVTADQLQDWNRWLRESHGLEEWPGNNIFVYRARHPGTPLKYFPVPHSMLLTPLRTIGEITIRFDRLSEQVLLTFQLTDDVRTIASLWFKTEALDYYTAILSQGDEVRNSLLKAFAEGRLWWGTICPMEAPYALSICYCFPTGFRLPTEKAQMLALPKTPPECEISLDLV